MVDVIVVEGGLFGVGEVLFTPSADPGDGLFFESARIPLSRECELLVRSRSLGADSSTRAGFHQLFRRPSGRLVRLWLQNGPESHLVVA